MIRVTFIYTAPGPDIVGFFIRALPAAYWNRASRRTKERGVVMRESGRAINLRCNKNGRVL